MAFGWLSGRRAPDYWAAIAPWQDAVDVNAAPHSVERQFERLPPPAGVIFAAHALVGEVRAGGFAQYFWSPAGVLAPEAQQAFVELGLPEAAAEIAEAMRVVGDPYPRVCEARRRILQGIWDRTPETAVRREGLERHTRAFRKAFGLMGLRRFPKIAGRYARRNIVAPEG